MINFRARTKGARVRENLFKDINNSKNHFSFVELSFHPTVPVQIGAKSMLSINPANIAHLAQVIP